MRGIAAAAATITKVPKSGALSIVNPPRAQSRAYPICTFTYAIVPLKAKKASTLKQFLNWAIGDGQQYGRKLLFYPLPKIVRGADSRVIRRIHS
jgi:ABC-type phosphate transport system substrate-binding protein